MRINFNYYNLLFLIFLILSILSFIFSFIFYLKKKNGLSRLYLKVIIFILHLITLYFGGIGIINFVSLNSSYIFKYREEFSNLIVIFNFAMFTYCLSVIILILSFITFKKSIINLEMPISVAKPSGTIKIGRIIKGTNRKKNFFLSLKDLEKHMFVCGTTGSGKTNFLQNFLINFKKRYKTPFFLVEFKGEYRFLQQKIDNLLILWPGENFSINIFNPEGANPKIHAERIFDIFKSGQFLDENTEYSPQMERVLVDLLVKTCETKQSQNWSNFEVNYTKYLKDHQKDIPMLSQTLISIKNRIRRFSEGPLRALFETNNNLNIKDLFKKDVILDLSSIIRLGGEKEDAFFFLNLLLKYLWDINVSEGASNYNGIRHLTIIEDAQYFAPKNLTKKNKVSTYLEDIALLQRGTGECLITLATRPDISKEILSNVGVGLTFKNHLDKETMCDLLNLSVDQKNYLSILEEGQCIIRVNSIKETFLLQIPHIKRDFVSISEISKNNNRILKRIKEETFRDINVENSGQLKFLKKFKKISLSFFIFLKNIIVNKQNVKKIQEMKQREATISDQDFNVNQKGEILKDQIKTSEIREDDSLKKKPIPNSNKRNLFTNAFEELKKKQDVNEARTFKTNIEEVTAKNEGDVEIFDNSREDNLRALKSFINDLYKMQKKRD